MLKSNLITDRWELPVKALTLVYIAFGIFGVVHHVAGMKHAVYGSLIRRAESFYMPTECICEEIYYFLFDPQQGFGVQCLYTADGSLDETYRVKNDELVEFPYGYHSTVSTPGYETYFLWLMAGDFARLSPRPTWMVGHDDVNRTGSMALDLHIHDVDFVRYLMNGDPDSIQTSSVKDENGIVQHIWTSYKYGDVVLMAEGSWNYTAGMPFAQTFRVRLERATVVLGEDGALKVYPEQGGVILPEIGAKEEMDMGINVSDMGPYLNEIKYFIETIETRNFNGIVPFSEAIASFRLAKKEMELA